MGMVVLGFVFANGEEKNGQTDVESAVWYNWPEIDSVRPELAVWYNWPEIDSVRPELAVWYNWPEIDSVKPAVTV
jgi:hypothetical protein